MPDDLITIRLRLTGGSAVAGEAKAVASQIDGIGSTTAAATGKASKETSRFRSTLGGLGRTMRYAAIPVVGALAYETVRAVNAYREARKVTEETNARIKSTGRVAGVTADEVARLAEVLSLKTGVDDEEVQSASNMLLTFTNIRNEVGKHNDIFDQATESVLDLAAASKTDAISAAKQLGKALNDPTTGLTALRRSGASFNTEQTEMIQKLFASGKRLKAQKLILRELSTEFAGSAKSQHDSIDRLGVAWENLEEKLGEAVYPVLQDVTRWLTKALRQAEHGRGPLIDLKNWFGEVGAKIDWVASNVLDPFVDTLQGAYDLYRKWWDLTHQQVLPGIDLSDVGVDISHIPGTRGAAHGPHRGSDPGAPAPAGQPQGKLPDLAPRARSRQSGAGKRAIEIRVPVYLDRKRIAEGVARASLEAGARA